MNPEQKLDIARAALHEYGRPDLAATLRIDKAGQARAFQASSDDERVLYRAWVVMRRSVRDPVACLDCWGDYRYRAAPLKTLEHCPHEVER